jgi:hypothetical protein
VADKGGHVHLRIFENENKTGNFKNAPRVVGQGAFSEIPTNGHPN